MSFDLQAATKLYELVAAQQFTASGSGSAVDIWLNSGPREIVGFLTVGSSSGSANNQTLDAKFQDASTGGGTGADWADITNGAFAQVGSVAANKEVRITGARQYVRAIYALGGTNPMYQFGVVGVAGNARNHPI